MKFLEIYIRDFLAFIESEEYKHFKKIPITRERAVSQYQNPNADAQDVGLIIALNDNNEMMGYIGILPDKIHLKNHIEKFYWNTCWWVDPLVGKKAAMPLFYRMLKITGMRQIFFELTPKTAAVIDKLPYFSVVLRSGTRLFFRSYLGEIFSQKNKVKSIAPVFKVVDALWNIMWCPLRSFVENNGEHTFKGQYEVISDIDEEVGGFIQQKSQKQLIRRGRAELNWIMHYPWLIAENENKSLEFQKRKYYFSHRVKSFRHYLVKLYLPEKKMIAFLIMNERNDHFSIPYLFCEPEKIKIAVNFIRYFLMKKKAKSFYTFNNQVLNVVEKWRLPHIFKLKLTKYMGFPANDKYKELKHAYYQDGDGDVVFTG